MYTKYHVTIQFNERIIGGIPKTSDKKLIDDWLKGQGVTDAKARAEIADQTAEEMAEQEEQEIEAQTTKAWSGFKFRDGVPVIEERQIKAMLKEVASNAGFTTTFRRPSLRQLLQHAVFTDPQYIPLLGKPVEIQESTGFTERVVHTWRGSAIKRADFVEGPVIDFVIEVFSNNELVRSRWDDRKETIMRNHGIPRARGMTFFDTLLKTLFIMGEKVGLGAWRTQGEGKFKVVEFERLPEPEMAEAA